ncbi:uL30 family ribosomal protein [Candidatus Woesearchaeota archaeon]|nr:uL30 family ribosomal protein [Candidatus Woesearchaeota archaeon]
MIAIVQVRGIVRASPKVRRTIQQLKLRKNNATYKEDTPEIRRMIKMIEDYITWGTVNEKIKANQPPRKGYGSIKRNYNQGGALGNRAEKISELLRRMQ